jgi:hypothetical protein
LPATFVVHDLFLICFAMAFSKPSFASLKGYPFSYLLRGKTKYGYWVLWYVDSRIATVKEVHGDHSSFLRVWNIKCMAQCVTCMTVGDHM